MTKKDNSLLCLLTTTHPLVYPSIYLFNHKRNKKQHFPSNTVKTTKYSIVTFIPLFLYNQFKYFINFFFLVIAIIACIPSLSSSSPVSSIVPVCIMITFSAIRELFDETRKYLSDLKLNRKTYKKLNANGEISCIKSKDIYAGDVLILPSNSRIPTDGIPITSTNEGGLVHVETSEIDGETTLKQKLVPSHFINKSKEEIVQLVGKFDTEKPNPVFDKFKGTFTFDDIMFGVNENNLIPQGCIIRNTYEILLFVVYCGKHTKLANNSFKPKIKFSHTNRTFNKFVAIALSFDFVVILTSVLLFYIFNSTYSKEEWWYLPNDDNVYKTTVLKFFSFLNMFSFLVPVSCLVTLEFSKTFQMLFMSVDQDMKVAVENSSGETEINGCRPWTSTLNDELGLVEYVLSDKTGTLTENLMTFKKASIDGIQYNEDGDGCFYKEILPMQPLSNTCCAKKQLLSKSIGSTIMTLPASLELSSNSEIPTSSKNTPQTKKIIPYFRKKRPYLPKDEHKTKQTKEFFLEPFETPTTLQKQRSTNTRTMSIPLPSPKHVTKQKIDTTTFINDDSILYFDATSNLITRKQPLTNNEVKEKMKMPTLNSPLSSLQSIHPPTENKFGFNILNKDCIIENKNQNFLSPSVLTSTTMAESVFKSKLEEFNICMAICHEAVVEVRNDDIFFQSSSPDEIALCEEAALNGYIFNNRTQKTITVSVQSTERIFHILALFPFNSTRKRMSILVRRWDGSIVLYTKGADSTTLPLMSPSEKENVSKTQEDVNSFARDGFRTLVLGHKLVPEVFYEKWMEDYDKSQSLVEGREEATSHCISLMEKDLCLLGVSAVEDKLQDGVIETISSLKRAGICMWMITGDKVETAINIGMSCGLVPEDNLIVIKPNTWERLVQESKLTKTYSVVFDYAIYQLASNNEHFWDFILNANAVICCRVTPLIKGEIVKKNGGNDVAMIKESDVGIGIFGKEGNQAAQTSDYAIQKFRHLQKLIFFHGRQALRRNTQVIKLSFYRNIAFILMQFWFGIQSGFSGQTLYEDFAITAFNMLMTSMPPLFVGFCDIDIPFFTAKDYPEAHREVIKGNNFTSLISYVGWIVLAIYQSVVLYIFVYFIISPSDVFSNNGKVNGCGPLSIFATFCSVITIHISMALSVKRWNIIVVFGFFLGIIFTILSIVVISFIESLTHDTYAFRSLDILATQPTIILTFFLFTIISITPIILAKAVKKLLTPSFNDILQELTTKCKGNMYGKPRPILIEGNPLSQDYLNSFCKPNYEFPNVMYNNDLTKTSDESDETEVIQCYSESPESDSFSDGHVDQVI
ncbi:Phospholipid-transporting ATPase [Entamoeba marina]